MNSTSLKRFSQRRQRRHMRRSRAASTYKVSQSTERRNSLKAAGQRFPTRQFHLRFSLLLSLLEPHPRASAILVEELDAGDLERVLKPVHCGRVFNSPSEGF